MSIHIDTPDADVAHRAQRRQLCLTKPPGSLGALEDLAVRIAAWQHADTPSVRPATGILFASDHPVTRHGVSPYPSAVTRAMLENFATGGAAANVLARAADVRLVVVDVGVDGPPTRAPADVAVVRAPVADLPAGDLRVEDAMSEATFKAALTAGRHAVAEALGARAFVLGDMGIGNTTPAAAVCAAVLGGEPGDWVGAGTGAEGAMLDVKRRVVRDAVARLGGETDPWTIVRRVGGREIAALLGAIQAALERRAIVLIDGFVVTAAALALARLEPRAPEGMIFCHRSAERAHGRVLEALNVRPLLDLSMRLGEGSGALLAFPLVDAACRLHGEMATFTSAAVPDRREPE